MPSAAHPNPFLNHLEQNERGSSKPSGEKEQVKKTESTPAFLVETVEEEKKGHDPEMKNGNLTP